MKVYKLTPIGTRLAHNIRYEPNNEWKIIHHINRMGGEASNEQIERYCGLSREEVASSLAKLQRLKVIVNETRVGV